MKSKLYIFDISNMIHRAFHAMEKNNLSTKDGFPTGAVYGTFNMLMTFIQKHRPQNILICYDAQDGVSVRKDLYPLYKSNRVQVNEVSAQEKVIRRIIELLGIESIEASGYEADDLIATAVDKYKGTYECVVVTGDKDLLQLVQDGVSVYDSMKDIYYSEEDVSNKFGVAPHQISSFLAIVGDKVDCIPGVKGIGKKGAQQLLSKFDSIGDILEKIEEGTWISGTPIKLEKKLRDDIDMAKISANLADLYFVDEADEALDNKDISFCPKINQDLLALLSRLDFDKSITKLQAVWRLYAK